MTARGRATPWLLLAPALAATVLIVLRADGADVVDVAARRRAVPAALRPFVGLANYAQALADPVFWESLGNSLVWVVGAVALQFLLGLGDGAAAQPAASRGAASRGRWWWCPGRCRA